MNQPRDGQKWCPWPGCHYHIPLGAVLCAHHWAALSQEARNTIQCAYADLNEGTLTPVELQGIVNSIMEKARGKKTPARR